MEIMMNRIKVIPSKRLQLILLSITLLVAACGGSTTVGDSPSNFSGNYRGTVNNQNGTSSPATLNLIQSSATTGTGDTAVTSVTIRGLLVVNPSDICEVSVDISEGTANNNSIIIELGSSTAQNANGDNVVTNTTDSGDLALTASGRTLTGNIRFTAPVGDCPRPSGAVVFRR